MSTSNLKISIAALSLCVSAVAIYIHLPCVIAAVSGSGAIEAVPLAIFAVSAIVALVSVICLIRLAVSRAGDKKKIDPSGEESGHTASQVPQEKSVKQDSRSQTDVARAISQNNNASSPSPSGGPPPPPPPPPSSNGTPLSKKADSPISDRGAMLNEIRQGKKLRNKEDSDKWLEKQAAKKLGSKGDQLLEKANSPNEIRQEQLQEKSVKQDSRSQTDVARAISQNNNASSPSPSGGPPPPPPPPPSSNGTPLPEKANINIGSLLYNVVEQKFPDEIRCPSSDGNLSDPPDSNGWSSNGDEEQNKQSFASAQADASIETTYETDPDEELKNCKDEPLNFQPDNERERPDSACDASPFNLMEQILLDRRKLIYPSSDSNLSDLSDSNGWSSNGDKEQDKQSFASAQADASIEDDYETDYDEELRNCKDEPLKFQPDNERERPDSGYKSKPSSPLDFKSEAEKPQVPASLQEEPSVTKVNNVDPVNSRA